MTYSYSNGHYRRKKKERPKKDFGATMDYDTIVDSLQVLESGIAATGEMLGAAMAREVDNAIMTRSTQLRGSVGFNYLNTWRTKNEQE